MRGASIVAFGAVSALGAGRDACSVGAPGEPPRVAIARDEELARAGLARPFAARADHGDAHSSGASTDRATTLLLFAMRQCVTELDRVRPGWRNGRVGLAIGTSSGGMRSAMEFFRGRAEAAEHATYFAPMHAAVQALGLDLEPASLILGACAAGTIALGLGVRWLETGACDLVLAGGFDAVSVFVAAGFEVLRATSTEVPPRPFRVARDGMALGEGAAILALAPSSFPARVYVAGFGASADAVHLTAPDRTGAGLARAIEAALADARLPGSVVDLVSAHGTATPFNDAAEARAIGRALGSTERAVVHAFKAQIGHTLGAAGALESLACADALERRVLPASAGAGLVDPDARVRLLDAAESGDPRVALKLSAAFGGANAALVLTKEAPSGADRAPRAAYLVGAVHVGGEPDLSALAVALGWPSDRLARCDGLSRRALAAIAALAARQGDLAGAGIVVGQAFATLECNLVFHRRMEERGARMAEPRRFPYTSPNAVAGEASVAFGLTGPGFAVGSGLHAGVEALVVGAMLVQSGDAERVVVVAVDEVGVAVARAQEHPAFADFSMVSGAVAALVSRAPEGAGARLGRAELRMSARAARDPLRVGHLGLLPLTQTPLPGFVESAMPFGRGASAQARVELVPL